MSTVIKPKVIKYTNAHDTNNFTVKEFECSHCYRNSIKQKVLNKLQQLRDYIKEPVFVISGYRCPTHNKQLGCDIKSFTEGTSANIRVVKEDGTWVSSHELGNIIEESGIFENETVILYKTYVHITISGKRVRKDKSL